MIFSIEHSNDNEFNFWDKIKKNFKESFNNIKQWISEIWNNITWTKEELSQLQSSITTEIHNKPAETYNKPTQWVSPYKLSPWEYPFIWVRPYKWIHSYDVSNVKLNPVLTYAELNTPHQWVAKLDWSNIEKWSIYTRNKTTWNKSNNPCDISHSSSDIWYRWAHTVADGQKLAEYNSPEEWIASAMRLLSRKYSNKSITEINTGGYQWYRKPEEEQWLSALRLCWITHQCEALNVWPHEMLDFSDPTTLKAFTARIAIQETWTHIGSDMLDKAYKLAFPSNNMA